MADFLSSGWSVFIIAVTLVSILACFWLAYSLGSRHVDLDSQGQTADTGHVWDEDLVELNNPLPRWWLYLFYITCVFGLVYLALYPGWGSYQGLLNWSQTGQYEAEVARVNERVQPLFDKYRQLPVEKVAEDSQAVEMGQRLYLTYCVQCHGSDARGGNGFPNLTDKDWLGADTPEHIVNTILKGRQAVMPPLAAAIGDDAKVNQLAHYVVSLSGATHDAAKAEQGKASFGVCGACHGADGKGNPVVGAPDLTDEIWLHGAGVAAVEKAVKSGISNQMPAFGNLIDENRAHVLAAYVWSLSNAEDTKE